MLAAHASLEEVESFFEFVLFSVRTGASERKSCCAGPLDFGLRICNFDAFVRRLQNEIKVLRMLRSAS